MNILEFSLHTFLYFCIPIHNLKHLEKLIKSFEMRLNINKMGLSLRLSSFGNFLLCCCFPVRFFSCEAVFLLDCLPVKWSFCKAFFLWGRLPVSSYSRKVFFLWGRLTVRLSSCEIFHLVRLSSWGDRPIKNIHTVIWDAFLVQISSFGTFPVGGGCVGGWVCRINNKANLSWAWQKWQIYKVFLSK